MYSFFKKSPFLIFIGISLWFWVSCAAVKQPPGGPKDIQPPELLFTHPMSGATHYSGGEIELIFNEYIDEKSIASAFNIYPQLSKKPDISYKGKKIIIHIPDSLNRNQTYILSLNRNLKDEHGVPIPENIQIAFSTGAFIDQGEISGRVFDDGDVSIHLWRIRETDEKPFFEKLPDYITDASDEGYYQFQYLSPGNYQAMAVKRSTAGMMLIPDRMAYGFPWVNQVHIDSASIQSNINMIIEQQAHPIRLLRSEWTDLSWGKAIFNQNITDWVNMLSLTIMNGDSLVPILRASSHKMDSSEIILIPKSNLNSDHTYLLNIPSVMRGNDILVDSSKVRFSTPTQLDTTYLKWVDQKATMTFAPDPDSILSVILPFSRPISLNKDSLSLSIQLSDSIPVEYELNIMDEMQLSISPLVKWEQEKIYKLQLNPIGIIPISGKSMIDSLLELQIQTTRYEPTGRLILSVKRGSIQNIKSVLMSAEKSQYILTKSVNSNALFDYVKVPEGRYRLMFFSDMNQNNKIDAGRAEPFQTGEWFTFYPDTIDIRANWDLELKTIYLETKP